MLCVYVYERIGVYVHMYECPTSECINRSIVFQSNDIYTYTRKKKGKKSSICYMRTTICHICESVCHLHVCIYKRHNLHFRFLSSYTYQLYELYIMHYKHINFIYSVIFVNFISKLVYVCLF